MANDIAESLITEITETFQKDFNASKKIASLYAKVRDGTATYIQANEFAIETGEILGRVFKRLVKAEDLPNGRMYYNIASRVMQSALGLDHRLISEMTRDVQKTLNRLANVGLAVFVPELDQSRVDGIVDRLSEAENYDDIKWILDEPLVNFSQSIVDDSIRGNVELQAKAGLEPTITRTAEAKACRWCRRLEGVYKYGTEPHDLYRRHENCRCQITYDPGTGKRQNAWSKKWL